MKDTIEYLLEHGASIKLPYKRNLPDWFSQLGVSLWKDKNKYVIYGDGAHNGGSGIEFDTLEEALKEFTEVHANNTGAIQQYVRHHNPQIENQWGDLDHDELRRLVTNEKRKRKRKAKKV